MTGLQYRAAHWFCNVRGQAFAAASGGHVFLRFEGLA